MKNKKRKLNIKKVLICLIVIVVVMGALIIGLFKGFIFLKEKLVNPTNTAYIASTDSAIELYDMTYKAFDKINRGSEVSLYKKYVINEETKEKFSKINYKGKKYLIKKDSTVTKRIDAVLEKELYIRTAVTVYKNSDNPDILSFIKKGEKVEITGYDKLNDDGKVTMYKVKYNEIEGYVYSRYLVNTKELSLKNYDEEGNYVIHSSKLADPYKVGMADKLDFYPNEKPKFENNIMPPTAKTLYINGSAISNADSYIKVAKNIGANAFVVDIKDGVLAYKSEIAKEYTNYAYDRSLNSLENYKANVKKLKDAGFYVIGRIVVFNDTHYAQDNKNDVIIYKNSGQLFGGQYWLTPYSRNVWEYNVKLALEAVKEVGFNEIQFDYVRFPDRTTSVNHLLDFRDKYGETKAEAVQNFLIYATNELHKVGVYVGVDVFGESAGAYVTGYGQYWPAISNVVDVISGMPYPDHFNAHAYGIKEIVWTVPEKLMTFWSADVSKRQQTIATPALVRTWIQSYNAIHSPNIVYGDAEIKAQIKGLYANGLTGGWMTWSSSSNLEKYSSFTTAFKENYE
ncbi:MAG: putative glycoside hydrolase [Bacilli bacterium]